MGPIYQFSTEPEYEPRSHWETRGETREARSPAEESGVAAIGFPPVLAKALEVLLGFPEAYKAVQAALEAFESPCRSGP